MGSVMLAALGKSYLGFILGGNLESAPAIATIGIIISKKKKDLFVSHGNLAVRINYDVVKLKD